MDEKNTFKDFFGSVFGSLKDDPVLNKVVDEVFKESKEDICYIHTYDIPDGCLRSGIIQKNGQWIYTICAAKDNKIQPLFGLIIHDPKELRGLARNLISHAEKMEIANETTP